jgi:hypothetical protein
MAGIGRIRRERLAFGVAEDELFADESGGLRIEFLGEFALQDSFVGRRAGKKRTLHAVERAARLGRFGHASDHGGVGLAVVANFGKKADLGIDLDDVG